MTIHIRIRIIAGGNSIRNDSECLNEFGNQWRQDCIEGGESHFENLLDY